MALILEKIAASQLNQTIDIHAQIYIYIYIYIYIFFIFSMYETVYILIWYHNGTAAKHVAI